MTAATLLLGAQIYLGIGGAVAVVFVLYGIDRIEVDARGVWAFRPLLVPGILLIWPLVLWRWWAIERRGAETAARYRPPHRLQGAMLLLLVLAVPVMVFGALVIRQDGPFEAAAEQLEPPR